MEDNARLAFFNKASAEHSFEIRRAGREDNSVRLESVIVLKNVSVKKIKTTRAETFMLDDFLP